MVAVFDVNTQEHENAKFMQNPLEQQLPPRQHETPAGRSGVANYVSTYPQL